MKLKLILRLNIDDPANGTVRRFIKTVTGEAPHVPRVGEGVVIPGGPLENLGARHVEEVIYPLDGSVILDFKLDGLTNDVQSQVNMLLAAGFEEVEARR
jgi:hypothetical protein